MFVSSRNFHTLSKLRRALPPLDAVRSRFGFSNNTVAVKQLLEFAPETQVVVNGWIDQKVRKVGKNLIFGTLRDCNGDSIQLVDQKSLLKSANMEDVVQVEGILLQKRSRKQGNESSNNKVEQEINITSVRFLNTANEKPSQLLAYKQGGNYPPEYRVLQLRHPRYHKFLEKRGRITKYIRDLLNDNKFTEIETPLLFKSTPEGAREFFVPTRKLDPVSLGPTFYALPQSPQQYKQLLMSSGFNRYFQVARCFRDEDLRADRQPEFTQVDLEMAFATGSQVMEEVTHLISNTWEKYSSTGGLLTLDADESLIPVSMPTTPIKCIKYNDAMVQYGIDKPDLRAPKLKILSLKEFNVHGHENPDFPVFEVLVLKNAFTSLKDYEKNWSFLTKKENYTYRSPIIVPIDSKEDQANWFEKFLSIATFENPKLLHKFLNIRRGDIICGSTREPDNAIFENPTPLGRLRQLVLESKVGHDLYSSTDKDVAAWVVEFPLFSPVEVANTPRSQYPQYSLGSYTSTHHPFTMVNISDYENLKTEPLNCRGQHYDLVVNGIELGGGSTRIHDPELQQYIFENILKIENPKKMFGHLLKAFELGTPPHAGFAAGLDRICAMLCGTGSIRDVVAFPKTISGTDMVVGSPSSIGEQVLNAYNICMLKNHQ